ncbi:MAG: transcriptional regulator [Sedimenticolaceae bacterium]
MKRVLTITLSSDWKANLEKAAATMQRGITSGKYQGEVLNFESPAVLFGKLTERRWNLVRELQRADGAIGVREVARRVERDVRRVHDDLVVLLELGLIERTDDELITCPFSDIHVDMHMRAA